MYKDCSVPACQEKVTHMIAVDFTDEPMTRVYYVCEKDLENVKEEIERIRQRLNKEFPTEIEHMNVKRLVPDDPKPKRVVDEKELRELGVPEELIQEALERQRRGLLDIEPPADLVEKSKKAFGHLFDENPKPRSE